MTAPCCGICRGVGFGQGISASEVIPIAVATTAAAATATIIRADRLAAVGDAGLARRATELGIETARVGASLFNVVVLQWQRTRGGQLRLS